MADKAMTGKEFPAVTWEVERGKIRELVAAIGDDNPVYTDREAALDAGYRDTPASATFITVPVMGTDLLMTAVLAIKSNPARILHGEESYEYFQEMYPGDVLTGKMKVLSIDEKSGKSGSMDLIKLETAFTNRNNQVVLKINTLIVERK